MTYSHNGVEYLLGSAGSLILACPKCGEEHFRDPDNYAFFRERGGGVQNFDNCFSCRTRMEPIRMDELESRWKPFWRRLGHEVID